MGTQKAPSRRSRDLRPEYDLAQLKGGVRGKYYSRAKAHGTIVLDPELSKIFPTSEAVNEALRALVAAARIALPPERRPRPKPA